MLIFCNISSHRIKKCSCAAASPPRVCTDLVSLNFWGQGDEATIGWLRHAEIKHGRVAMAAFVGFCVQTNGIPFPWNLAGDLPYADLAALPAPGDQWDAVPAAGKLQILFTILILEWV